MRSSVGASRRALDLAIVTLASPVWLPILLVCSVLVLATTGRPVLFRQVRVGLGGDPFTMLKFRSMRNGDHGLLPDPDVITRAGELLRRLSLDELPQLLNVLGGHMSLVGPRPMLPEQAERLTPEQQSRHAVRPGLTGIVQVRGRNELTWDERISLDRDWVDDPSAKRYLRVLAATAAVVCRGAGVAGHPVDDPIAFGRSNADTAPLEYFDIGVFELAGRTNGHAESGAAGAGHHSEARR